MQPSPRDYKIKKIKPERKIELRNDFKSNALTTSSETNYIIIGGAFRGINPENTSDRTPGAPTEQRLEINETGKSNALTSVSKDSLCIHVLSEKALNRIERKKGYKPQIMPDKTGTLNTKNNSGQLSIDNGTTLIPMGDNITWRKLTPRECARLQTIPEDLIDKMLSCGVSNSQLYKMLGNGWTVDVIMHIFRELI
jgi:site-specific DNA-cytosine methylase